MALMVGIALLGAQQSPSATGRVEKSKIQRLLVSSLGWQTTRMPSTMLESKAAEALSEEITECITT